VYRNVRWLLMFAGATVIVLVGATIVGHARPVHPELIPVTIAAVVLSALFDQRISMLAVMVIAVLVGGQSEFRGTNGVFINRVGAYYHDIGKIAKPQYFVENQAKGRNPHDKLKPGTSAQIIRNHVREGLEMAEEHKLPRALRAFITEHHGTGPIAYFLEKAKERGGVSPDPNEFSYPGPLPQTAETAVVMLADGVEAATRVLA